MTSKVFFMNVSLSQKVKIIGGTQYVSKSAIKKKIFWQEKLFFFSKASRNQGEKLEKFK